MKKHYPWREEIPVWRDGADGLKSIAEWTGERSMKEMAGRASWERAKDRDEAGKDCLS